MYEFIPSRDVREYDEKIGRVFNDFEKAAIIYRSCKSKQEILKGLQKIADTTNDWVGTTRELWEKEREDIKNGKYPEADSTFGALVIIYDKQDPYDHDHIYPEMLEKVR